MQRPLGPLFPQLGRLHRGRNRDDRLAFPGDPTPNPPSGIRADATLHASPNCGGSGDPLGWVSTASGESTWAGGAKTIDAGSGSNALSIEIHWRFGSGAGANKSKCFGLVAASYAADDASGPLEYVRLTGSDPNPPYPPTIDANSRNIGSNHNVLVTVGLNKPIQLTDPLLPPFLLRFASKSGSLNQALDCDSGIVFKDEIADGCRTTYRLNYFDWDNIPTTPYTWNDIACSAYPSPSDLPPPTFSPPPGTNAPDCVAAKTGDVVSMRQGLYKRFQIPSCTPNNWPKDQPPAGHDPADEREYGRSSRTTTSPTTRAM